MQNDALIYRESLKGPFGPSRCIKASFCISGNRLNFPTTKGFWNENFQMLKDVSQQDLKIVYNNFVKKQLALNLML